MKPDFEKNLFDKRLSYEKYELDFSNLSKNPYDLFSKWYTDAEALLVDNEEANAVALSTSDKGGIVSSRMVLIKFFSEQGFVFFTHYLSKKGKQLSENKHCSLLFFWSALQRQIRIEGVVEKVEDTFSDQYFEQRPLESRSSAVVSPQSQEIENKEVLIYKMRSISGEKNIKRPEYWGGYLIKPHLFEFWQGRPGRFHDRLEYYLDNKAWKHRILAP